MWKQLPEMVTILDVQQNGRGMKLKELESLLRGAAERLGVTFIEERVTSGSALMALHPRAVAIIGADGRHSMLRETLLVRAHTVSGTRGAHEPCSKEHIKTRVIEHTVDINFALQGDDALKAHNLEGGALQNIAFSAADSVLYAGHHPVRPVVGKRREETIPMTAIFFIDAKTAETVSDCKQKSEKGPGKLSNDSRIPADLSADIRRYMTQRFGDHTIDLDTLELIYVAIDRYCSDVIGGPRSRRGVSCRRCLLRCPLLPRTDQRPQMRRHSGTGQNSSI